MLASRRHWASELTLWVALVCALHLAGTVHSSALTHQNSSNNNNHNNGKQSPQQESNIQPSQPGENYVSEQANGTKQPAASQQTPSSSRHHEGSTSKQRSNNEEHDDMVPLATINNHSRNNQNLLRPPQYVDVSALVGSSSGSINGNNGGQRNLSSSSGTYAGTQQNQVSGGATLGANTISANSLLTPKSRSGLPECATQQVCNAIFVRMNHTQRLCECSSNYNWKCSNNLDPQDGHTIELTRKYDKRIYTQIKTCEPLREVRACKSPTDWTLLALQSERSGKAHYVVVCKCPTWAQLEGPYTHNHPPYANIPGIRVYGMLCAHQTARSSTAQSYSAYNPALNIYPEFPWSEALNVLNTTNLANTLDGLPH